MSALFVSCTPVLEAPAVLEHRPAASLRYDIVSEITILLIWNNIKVLGLDVECRDQKRDVLARDLP